jgi:hypothetical protein
VSRCFIALAFLASACGENPPEPALHVVDAVSLDPGCNLDAGDRAWLEAAPQASAIVERDAFGLSPITTPPAFILYDAACAYRSADGIAWQGPLHGGQVKLPDGGELPPVVASFASTGPDVAPFMVMGLPTIWRADGVTSELGLEALMFAVFAHEMAHVRQFDPFGARISALAVAGGFGDDFDDDLIQTRFESDPEFASSVARERELLFAAAETVETTEAQRLAAEALAMIEARRARWYAGADARYAGLEDQFLSMEGVGQFAGFAWMIHADGGGVAREAAIAGMRRGGRKWSQDEGLAIYLAIDRLKPGWPAEAFGPEAKTALELLALAVSEPGTP